MAGLLIADVTDFDSFRPSNNLLFSKGKKLTLLGFRRWCAEVANPNGLPAAVEYSANGQPYEALPPQVQ